MRHRLCCAFRKFYISVACFEKLLAVMGGYTTLLVRRLKHIKLGMILLGTTHPIQFHYVMIERADKRRRGSQRL